MDALDSTVFYISAAVSLLAGFLAVTRKNPVYSTLFMVLFFTMISLDFLILRAPFLAVIQVLVYAGAILVLYLFVIMLLNLKPEELKEEVTINRKAFALVASLLLFIILAKAIRTSPRVVTAPSLTAPLPESAPGLKSTGEVSSIAQELFQNHALAFELTSILILVAIIGAIYLTKKRLTPAPAPSAPAEQSEAAPAAREEKEEVLVSHGT